MAERYTRREILSLGGASILPAPLSPSPGSSAPSKTQPRTLRPIQFVSWGGIGSIARVRAAARIGIDTHRFPIGWPDSHGHYDLPSADEMVRALHEEGINGIVHFYNHGVPAYFWQKYPQAKMRNALGATTDSSPSFWNPAVKQAIKNNMSRILEHFKKAKLLEYIAGYEIGIGMEGQLSYLWDAFWAFDPYAIKAYRAFLEAKYNADLDALNQDWGTKYLSFQKILPPPKWQYTRECATFEAFYRDHILQTAIELSALVKKHTAPTIWFWLSHFIKSPERYYAARFPAYYMQRLGELGCANAVETSVVPGWQTQDDIADMRIQGLRVIGEIYITPTPQQQREHARLSQALGCDGFFVGTLENLFYEDGTPTPAGDETAKIIALWKQGDQL